MDMDTCLKATFAALCAAIVAVIIYAVVTGTNTTEPGTSTCPPGCCPAVVVPVEDYMTNPVEPADDELCGRYHYRSRTTRLFRRSIS